MSFDGWYRFGSYQDTIAKKTLRISRDENALHRLAKEDYDRGGSLVANIGEYLVDEAYRRANVCYEYHEKQDRKSTVAQAGKEG